MSDNVRCGNIEEGFSQRQGLDAGTHQPAGTRQTWVAYLRNAHAELFQT